MSLTRRTLLAAGAGSLAAGCARERDAALDGGWVGDASALGHRVRDRAALPAPAQTQRCAVVIVGGGIAALAAARALMRAGIDDFVLLDANDAPGGNSRGHRMGGGPCPLGAHYLPTPGPEAHEVTGWLHEIGLARTEHGRTVYDERHLCHSPQERLFFDGAWHEGLLPPVDPSSAGTAQYRRFADRVKQAQAIGFALPTRRAAWAAEHAALDAQTFAAWLSTQGLDDPLLRWYLDYCCRDDYGAGADTVSAWAGLHYFASRHGFNVEAADDGERDAVLTWPQGNGWLVERLAAPLGERFRGGCVALRVAEERERVTVDAWDGAGQGVRRVEADCAVLATPLFVAARVLESAPAALTAAAARLRYAPWLVANLQLSAPLLERVGAPLAWDNVVYGSAALGYVHAGHQSLGAAPRATLLTAYHALPSAQRAALLERPWRDWAGLVIDTLTPVHPDLPRKVERVDLARHGHAMAIPAPGVRGDAALAALATHETGRLRFAHADLAGYSVFEEAFTAGDAAGRSLARRLHG